MSSYGATCRLNNPEAPSIAYMDNRARPGNETGVYYIVLANVKNGATWRELKDFIRSIGVEVEHVEVHGLGAWVRVNGKENFRKVFDHLDGGVFRDRCLIAHHNEKTSIAIPKLKFRSITSPTYSDTSISSPRSTSVSWRTAGSWASPTPSYVTAGSATTVGSLTPGAGYQNPPMSSYPSQLQSCSTSYMQGGYAQGYGTGEYGEYAQGGFTEAGYGTNDMGQPEYAGTNTSSYNTGSTAYASYQNVHPAESYATDVNATAESMQQLSMGNEPMVELVYRKIIISHLSERRWGSEDVMRKMIKERVSSAVERDIVTAEPNSASTTGRPRYSYSMIFRTPEAAREAVRKLDGLGLNDCRLRAKLANEGVAEGSSFVFAPPTPASESSSKKHRSSKDSSSNDKGKDKDKRERWDKNKPIIVDGSKHRDKKKSG